MFARSAASATYEEHIRNVCRALFTALAERGIPRLRESRYAAFALPLCRGGARAEMARVDAMPFMVATLRRYVIAMLRLP